VVVLEYEVGFLKVSNNRENYPRKVNLIVDIREVILVNYFTVLNK